ncbi:MAG TPA: DUF1343 domain-containing protein [Tepidisphaeraceae bacterium]|jgi:uncharacterized protein YbbC (DUF1343 family)
MTATPLALLVGALLALLSFHAHTAAANTDAGGVSAASRAGATTAPITAADQTDQYVPLLKGKRVALVANPTSIIGGKPSADVLPGLGVKIVKIFGPEHGFRGNASNGTSVTDEIDAKTGIPIISLYGPRKKPRAADLADVDVMVYDIQDMGVRFYTNINTLRDVMDSCAENDVEMMVLDRPNPHAYLIDGPVLDMKLKSGIGQFPIPIAHGMTVGEFAQMINGEGWLENGAKKKCKLKVIPIANYTHETPYTLPVSPSPNLNTPQAVMLYPSTCLFEGTILNHGRGTMMPFTVMGAPALKGKYEFSYTPQGIRGMSEDPVHKGEVCYGLDLRNYDAEQLRKRRQINLSWMIELYNAYPDKSRFFDSSYHKQIGNIDKLSGTTEFKKQIIAGMSEEEIRKTWQPGLEAFKKVRAQYLIYP